MDIRSRFQRMNVHLGERFESYVRKLVSTGRYNNASEVIREALRLKMQADDEQAAKLEALRRDVGLARVQVRRDESIATTAKKFLNRPKRSNG